MKRTIITGLLLLGGMLLGATASAQEQRSADGSAATEQPAAQLSTETAETAETAGTAGTAGTARPDLGSETPEQLWDAASTAYINGNYHEAVRTTNSWSHAD